MMKFHNICLSNFQSFGPEGTALSVDDMVRYFLSRAGQETTNLDLNPGLRHHGLYS